MNDTIVSKLFIRLSVMLFFFVAVASFCGAFIPSTYSKESLSWAAQGIGQDIVTLFVILPTLLISTYLLSNGSIKAFFVWLGTLFYILYSYILYAFFIHFGWIFLVYVSILGLSFYTIFGSLSQINAKEKFSQFLENKANRAISIFLMISGIMFYFLWLSDILKALLSGTLPKDVAELGFLVNPVHVLDMAFLLPAMIIVSILLQKKKVSGVIFAVPVMVFALEMGLAIISMVIVQGIKGVYEGFSPALVIMGTLVVINLFLTRRFMKDS